jgi:hypothetical protein
MLRHFLVRFSGWGAILLQAGLFALWHLSWPARLLLDGEASYGIFNVLFISTSKGMQVGFEFGLFAAIFLIGYLLLIPIIQYASKRLDMPEVKPWGEFVAADG